MGKVIKYWKINRLCQCSKSWSNGFMHKVKKNFEVKLIDELYVFYVYVSEKFLS